jgi:hypothetical protein
MWITGAQIVKNWGILPEELIEAFQRKLLTPWNRLKKRHITKEELLRLGNDLFGSEDELYPKAIQRSIFKEQEAREYFESLGIKTNFTSLQTKNQGDIEALRALVLKSEGNTWNEIALEIWPQEKYAPDNKIHKRVERRLQQGKKIINDFIQSHQT